MSGEVGVHDMTSMLTHAVEQIDRAFIDDLPVIQSGIPSLDLETGGLAAGEVVLLLWPKGRAIEMLLHAVLRNLKQTPGPRQQGTNTAGGRSHVTLLSLHESAVEIGTRFIAMQSGLPYGRLRRGKVNDEEWPELIQAVGMLNERKDFLLIDRTASLQEVKRLIAHHHTDERMTQRILFVDSAEAAIGRASLKEIMQLVGELGKQISAPVVILHSTMASICRPWFDAETMDTIRRHCRHVRIVNACGWYSG